MSGAVANAGKSVLKQGAKRDPELYILLAVMSGAFGLAGFYFGRKPTSATSEEGRINVAKDGMPWHGKPAETSAGDHFKYKYHPGGDARNAPKDAPSALHSVIVPNVNLPKELHDKYNKWGKDGY
ncbi:hypothetical protein B9Z19DRAFT_969703 [Tuber borchii]|uniref:NADH-ubiquinone reductase complex 1 MLRQ subunit-domain-containing protein n=1 Tax=Tuber borchii TaxID=42251 RepID=A0A2T7A2P6_TUBBO|nr:hypothetical protein B9Z19DRAFT_969703 [Tuber borchii]